MKHRLSTGKWVFVGGCIVALLGIPLLAGADFISDYFPDTNKVKFESKMRLPEGKAEVEYKTWTGSDGTVKKKFSCKMKIIHGAPAPGGNTAQCQLEVGGSFVTLAEGQVYADEDGEIKGKAVLRGEEIPQMARASFSDGARVQVVLHSNPPINFQGLLEEVGKKAVSLKAKMRHSSLGKAKVKYESRIKTDGSTREKLTCQVELELISGVKPDEEWTCYSLVDGVRHEFGALALKVDERGHFGQDDIEGKLVLKTPTDEIPKLVEGTQVFISPSGSDRMMFRGMLHHDD